MQTETNSRFLKIAKSASMLFVIGVALSVGIPAIMGALGASGAVATISAPAVLSTGLFFAGFGALNELINPFFDKIFGTDQPTSNNEIIVINSPSRELSVGHTSSDIEVVDKDHSGFAKKILDEKLEIKTNGAIIS